MATKTKAVNKSVKKQKKVVKKKVAKLIGKVENIDIVELFKTGKRHPMNGNVYIDNGILYCYTGCTEGITAVAINADGIILINGDDVMDNSGDFENTVEELQDGKSDKITTSFKCLINAGINLAKVRVLEMTKDLDVAINKGRKGFDTFENTVPQGATYSENEAYREADCDDMGNPNLDAKPYIYNKRYHRAGCLLLKYGKFSYICGMDEDSYFVTKLSNNPKTIEAAFMGLKPKIINAWEKKNGKQAQRQGEWFFIPFDGVRPKGMKRKALPLQDPKGNKHIPNRFVESDGKLIVMGNVDHNDHESLKLGDKLHEAIESTQLGSWSEQGVD